MKIVINSPRTSTAESNRLDNGYDNLEQEYKEEDHEVEWGVAPERLVYRPVPADEAEGRQQYEVQDREAERREAVAGEHQRHRADYVQRKNESVDWKLNKQISVYKKHSLLYRDRTI